MFQDNRAVGVRYIQGESAEIVEVAANKEVLLAAGTIGSAKLLLLSGVGPQDHLTELKVILSYSVCCRN